MSGAWSLGKDTISPSVESPSEVTLQVSIYEQELCPRTDCAFGIEVSAREVAVNGTASTVYKFEAGCPRKCSDIGRRAMHANANLRMIMQGFLRVDDCYGDTS